MYGGVLTGAKWGSNFVQMKTLISDKVEGDKEGIPLVLSNFRDLIFMTKGEWKGRVWRSVKNWRYEGSM